MAKSWVFYALFLGVVSTATLVWFVHAHERRCGGGSDCDSDSECSDEDGGDGAQNAAEDGEDVASRLWPTSAGAHPDGPGTASKSLDAYIVAASTLSPPDGKWCIAPKVPLGACPPAKAQKTDVPLATMPMSYMRDSSTMKLAVR